MAGGEELLGLFYRKGPLWYAAKGRRALYVPVGGGEAPSAVHGVLRDVHVSPVADVLLRGY